MKTYYLITLLMALVGGGAIIIGLANTPGKADEKVPIADGWEVNAHQIHGETGLANALDKVDEKVPIADAWVVSGPQIQVEIKNGQVMLRHQINVDAAWQTAENIAHGLDGGNNVRDDDPERVALSPRKAVKSRQGSMKFDDKSRAALSTGLHADRVKLMIIYSLYLRSMSALGPV
jgi:osmotically-inducible protein OsmY